VTGQPVLKEIIIVDAIEQHGEHCCTYSETANTEQTVNPVPADTPPSGLNVMQKHKGFFQF
jgi:hypothetical protein